LALLTEEKIRRERRMPYPCGSSAGGNPGAPLVPDPTSTVDQVEVSLSNPHADIHNTRARPAIPSRNGSIAVENDDLQQSTMQSTPKSPRQSPPLNRRSS
jgi:hypothetical protein